MEDFTRGAEVLRFLWPDDTRIPTAVLHEETLGLKLSEEGESIGFLMFEWLKHVVLRRADGSPVFTVHRRSDFTSRARVVAADGSAIAAVHRSKRTYHAGVTRLELFASGVLTGPHGEVIVRPAPEDRELVRLKFAPGATPEVRAAMIGIAVLYEHDFRGDS